jgi:hypothetical protein
MGRLVSPLLYSTGAAFDAGVSQAQGLLQAFDRERYEMMSRSAMVHDATAYRREIWSGQDLHRRIPCTGTETRLICTTVSEVLVISQYLELVATWWCMFIDSAVASEARQHEAVPSLRSTRLHPATVGNACGCTLCVCTTVVHIAQRKCLDK